MLIEHRPVRCYILTGAWCSAITTTGYLTNRGYHEDEIQQQIGRTMGIDRDALLRSKITKTPLERVLLIVLYPGLPPLRSILEKHSSILRVSERLKQFAKRHPPLVAYQCLPNLRTLLVQATFKQKTSAVVQGGIPGANKHVVKCVTTSNR